MKNEPRGLYTSSRFILRLCNTAQDVLALQTRQARHPTMMYLTYCTHPPGPYEHFPPDMMVFSFIEHVHEQQNLTFDDLVERVRDLSATLVAGDKFKNYFTMQAIMVYSFLTQQVLHSGDDTISIRYE